MAEERSHDLEQRRDELTRSLPGLSEKRANTYRLNSDALALDRAGVKHQATQEMERLKGNEAAADTAIRDAQQELRQLEAEIERMPRRASEQELDAPFAERGPTGECSALTRRAVDLFDAPGLFMVRLDQPKVVSAVEERLASLAHERPGPPRVRPIPRQKRGLHRYCSGCAHETEHVAWSRDGRASIPSIRWPAAEPAGGTTICLNCGQWRAAASQPCPPAWSGWPRKLIAMRNLAITADPARAAADGVSETAAENEGMPPKREPPRARRSARVRRVPAAARS
jgi:hypothetical protein